MNMLQYSIHFYWFLMLVGLRLMQMYYKGHGEVKDDIHVVAYCYQLLNQVICTRILTLLFL
jgi:hypothetical protein